MKKYIIRRLGYNHGPKEERYKRVPTFNRLTAYGMNYLHQETTRVATRAQNNGLSGMNTHTRANYDT